MDKDKGENMDKPFNPDDYRDVKKRVKLIVGTDADDCDRKAAEFEKHHSVIGIIQNVPNVMIIFYADKDE